MLLRNDPAPSRIVLAGKKLALALGLTASVCNASVNEAAFPVELCAANDAIKHCAVSSVRPSAGAAVFPFCHDSSIEKSGEFGETPNCSNDTLIGRRGQYRAKPFSQEMEGVTTSAWSPYGTVKRHETPAREGRYSLSYGETHRSADKEPHDNNSDSDWDVLSIAQSDVISSAEYQWRQIALNVVASGRDIRVNSGDSQIIDLVKGRMKNAIRTFQNNFCSDIYSAGSLSNQVNGLQAIIADVNTNTVGGIDANTWSFWQNTVYDFSADSVTASASTMESSMLKLWVQIDRGPDDQPDLIVMDTVYYGFYEGSQVSLKRYSGSESASGGFVTIKYKNADVLFDGNSGIPASHAYFCNTNYLQLAVHRDADLEIMDELRPVNQDGSVTPILWMGNLTCSNRKLQGVMIA